ncbi:DUF932 domain-containing protein, partial [Sphingobacterium daejeonense]|uniref:DUF932 domain-containing protein n=1 Tax=Sphingobacterium daejeonense TaxID=371142 RepID=UPI003D31917E
IVGGTDGVGEERGGGGGKGERRFNTAKLASYIRVGNGDDVTEKYIFLTTSQEKNKSITDATKPGTTTHLTLPTKEVQSR